MKSNLSKRKGIINEKTLIVTVDFGKVANTGYCRCPDGTEKPSFEFFNNGRGFFKFWGTICWMMKKHQLDDVIVAFESTGPYWEPLIHFLNKRKVRLMQVNPSHTKKIKEVYDNSPNKTDAKDPKVIADLVELGRFLSVVIPEGTVAELRQLSHARERHLEGRGRLYNQLHDLAYLIFPELMQVMKSIASKSCRFLLKRYPAPEAILALGCADLGVLLKKVSRGHFGKARAAELYEAARDSVGLKAGRIGMLGEINQILNLIASCDDFIAEIEQKQCDYLQDVPYSRCLLSIKGLGAVTVAGLIGEVGDFGKFKTIGELLKYAGLNLYEISSGIRKGQRRISKRGRALMRKLLYFAALNVVRKGGILHDQYQSYLKRGMLKLKALVAICRKLLGIMFALVRDHSEYITDYRNSQLLKQAA